MLGTRTGGPINDTIIGFRMGKMNNKIFGKRRFQNLNSGMKTLTGSVCRKNHPQENASDGSFGYSIIPAR